MDERVLGSESHAKSRYLSDLVGDQLDVNYQQTPSTLRMVSSRTSDACLRLLHGVILHKTSLVNPQLGPGDPYLRVVHVSIDATPRLVQLRSKHRQTHLGLEPRQALR